MREGKIMLMCLVETQVDGAKSLLGEYIYIEMPDFTGLLEEQIMPLLGKLVMEEKERKKLTDPFMNEMNHTSRFVRVHQAILFPAGPASWYEDLDWNEIWKQIKRNARLNALIPGV